MTTACNARNMETSAATNNVASFQATTIDRPVHAWGEISPRIPSAAQTSLDATPFSHIGARSFQFAVFATSIEGTTPTFTVLTALARPEPAQPAPRPEPQAQKPSALGTVASQRIRMLAAKYAGRASTENLARLAILDEQMNVHAPRVEAARWEALDVMQAQIEHRRAAAVERFERLVARRGG